MHTKNWITSVQLDSCYHNQQYDDPRAQAPIALFLNIWLAHIIYKVGEVERNETQLLTYPSAKLQTTLRAKSQDGCSE